MAIETVRDVYRHQLGELYHAEQQVLALLDRIELDTSMPEVRDRIRAVRNDTLRQIGHLERCFELAGASAPRVDSEMARGIVAEREHFLREQPLDGALDLYDIHCIARVAALKRESYRQVERLASTIRQNDACRLLAVNRRDEEALAEWLEQSATALLDAPSLTGRTQTSTT